MPRSSKARMHLVNLAESKVFRSTIFFMIILNCMLLAMDSPPRVGQERVVLDLIQLPIYSSFIFEMIVLLIGSGPSTYWQDPWNRMDLLIVVGSIIDLITHYTVLREGSDEDGGAESLSVLILLTGFRTLRAFRPLRMLRRAKTLRRLGLTIVKSLAAISSAMGIFLAFIFLSAVLLLQFLAGRLSQCSDENIHYKTGCVGFDALNRPRRWFPSSYNVDWIGPALLTALGVASGNGWGAATSRALNAAYEGQGPLFRSSIEMLSVYLIIVLAGRFLFANLFLGILSQAYSQTSKERRHKAALQKAHLQRLVAQAHSQHKRAARNQIEAAEKIQLSVGKQRVRNSTEQGGRRWSENKRLRHQEVQTAMQRQKELASTSVQQVDDDGDDLEDFISRKLMRKDLPLLYIEPKSRPRRVCFRLLQRKELETVVLVAIVLNAFCSGLSTLKPGLIQQHIALHAEYVLSGIFSLELTIRLLAYHPRAFLQSYWNILDYFLVMSTALAVCLTVLPPHERQLQIPISPQLLRTARTFRAARLMNFSPAVMGSLAEALPKMLTLVALCLIVLFGCSSMGVSMLSNLCILGGHEQLTGDNALRCLLVEDVGKLQPHSNFRNILMSLLTLVRFSTGDGKSMPVSPTRSPCHEP